MLPSPPPQASVRSFQSPGNREERAARAEAECPAHAGDSHAACHSEGQEGKGEETTSFVYQSHFSNSCAWDARARARKVCSEPPGQAPGPQLSVAPPPARAPTETGHPGPVVRLSLTALPAGTWRSPWISSQRWTSWCS